MGKQEAYYADALQDVACIAIKLQKKYPDATVRVFRRGFHTTGFFPDVLISFITEKHVKRATARKLNLTNLVRLSDTSRRKAIDDFEEEVFDFAARHNAKANS